MLAARLHRFGEPLVLEEVPCPKPQGEEVLVRVLAAGVCHTDLHLLDGAFQRFRLPRILGHEIAGVAEGIGEVLVYACWGCGDCRHCRVGDEQLCPRAEEAGWARDGGYAEYVLVPSRRYLLPLQGLDPVRAAPLADAGLTPFRAVRRIASRLSDGDRAVVIGIGGLGQFGLQYLRRLTPASVVAVDRDLGKLSMAKALGCTEALPPDGLDGEAAAVLDFVGSNESLALAARVVRRGGTVLQIGEAGGRLSVGLGRFPHEATYTSSIWGSLAELREVLDLARRGEVRCTVEALPLSEAAQAFDRLRSGDVRGRLVLVPSQGRATGAAPPI